MLPRVRAQLEVHAGDPDQPERATLELTRALLSEFPRQRPITLALIGFAPHPGLTPTPWLLDGVLEACVEAERTPLNLLTFADTETGEALLRKVSRALLGGADGCDLIERPSRDRSLSLRSRGQRRPFVIPREVVGSSLIVCTPLLFRALDQGRTRQWQGPLALALGELARAWGYAAGHVPGPTSAGLRPRPEDDGREAAAAGLELIAASFASAAMILDATWAGALEPAPTSTSVRARASDGRFVRSASQAKPEIPRLLGELESPERCLALRNLDRLELEALLGVDHWLARVTGLSRRESELPAPLLGEASPGRWPQLSVTEPRSQPTRLADRAISGIRAQSKRLSSGIGSTLGLPAAREQPALPARVPGRFAQQWTARWYGELERAGSARRMASAEPR
jgi:hypothetical protein